MITTEFRTQSRTFMLLFLLACNDGTLNTKNINATPEATIILPDSNDGGDVEAESEVLFRAVLTDADPNDQSELEARWRVDSNPEPICDYTSAKLHLSIFKTIPNSF